MLLASGIRVTINGMWWAHDCRFRLNFVSNLWVSEIPFYEAIAFYSFHFRTHHVKLAKILQLLNLPLSELCGIYKSIAVVVLQQQWSTIPQYLPFSLCRAECVVTADCRAFNVYKICYTNYSQHAQVSIKYSSRMHAGSIYMVTKHEKKQQIHITKTERTCNQIGFYGLWLWRFNWQLIPRAMEK